MEEIRAYRENGLETGAFDSVNRVIVDHFKSGDGVDELFTTMIQVY